MANSSTDHNIFAVLTPSGEERSNAINVFQLYNAMRSRPGITGFDEEPTLDSREPTPDLSDTNTDEEPTCIVLYFDDELVNPQNMWQFGTRPTTSDILLGRRGTYLAHAISARHFNLTIDGAEHSIWLHDYYSSCGSAVGYDGQLKDEKRCKDSWILSHGPASAEKSLGEITIYVGRLSFKIDFPNHQAAHPKYMNNLRAFIQKCKNASPTLDGLALESDPPSEKPSQVHTPNTHPIFLQDEQIGRGSFGEVWRVIKLRDGKHYAGKYFSMPPRRTIQTTSTRKRNHDASKIDEAYQTWLQKIRREYTIMQKNPHPHIVQVVDFREAPEPLIVMELYPLGNIKEAGISYDQYVTAFGQILVGLCHLHKNGARKFAEDDNPLQTFCGTLQHVAPEIFPGYSDTVGYGPEVDIWSAGVIMLEWMYNRPTIPPLPTARKYNHGIIDDKWRVRVDTWIELLLNKLDDQESDDAVACILLGMIEPDPRKRWSAEKCLSCGLSTGLFKIAADGRVVGSHDPDERDDSRDDNDREDNKEGMITPTQRSPDDVRRKLSEMEGRLLAADVSRPPRVRELYGSVDARNLLGHGRSSSVECVNDDENNEGETRLPPVPQNLSTRSLRWDRKGTIYVVIRQQEVAMRTSDYGLNASEICIAAGLKPHSRGKYFNLLKRHCIVTKENNHLWAPFRDGVFLSRAIGVAGELHTLFAHAPLDLPLESENYFKSAPKRMTKLPEGYAVLYWGDVEIVYIPSEKKINATHLIRLRPGLSRKALADFLHDQPKTILRGHPRAQGTYIDLKDARKLCQRFGLDQNPIEELLTPEVIPEDTQLPLESDPMDKREALLARSSLEAIADLPESALDSDFMGKREAPAGLDHYSQYTERENEHGSFLLSPNRSYSQHIVVASNGMVVSKAAELYREPYFSTVPTFIHEPEY